MSKTERNEARFFAISGIGWGKGHSIEAALENYYEINEQNWRHMLDGKTKRARIATLKKAPPAVWFAPEGVVGFSLTFAGLEWEMDSGATQQADPAEVVEPEGGWGR